MTDDIHKWSRKNWDRVPELVRIDCLNELKAQIPNEIIQHWCDQYQAGEVIGSDDDSFHLGAGMAVRNYLRKQLTDGELPDVVGPDGGYAPGQKVRNWDDFYLGALQELCEKILHNGHSHPYGR